MVCVFTNSFLWLLIPASTAISFHPSLTLPPTIHSFPSRWGNRESRQEWLKHMSEDVRASVVAYEMKLSEEMLSVRHPSIKGIFVSSPLLCLSSVALLNYTVCMLVLLLSGAWHSYTVGMHRAKFWHSAPETALCCGDVLLKGCLQRQASWDQEKEVIC